MPPVTQFQIIYWRDIPAQVKVRLGRNRLSQLLTGRFQEAIDEAAMRAKVVNTDDYLAEWRTTVWEERAGDPEAVSAALLAELEQAYPAERLQALILSKGYDVER
jgi:hypothetical protein